MVITAERKQALDAIFHAQGCTDYRWIAPTQIDLAQWVHMKCMFGRGGACPPNTPLMVH